MRIISCLLAVHLSVHLSAVSAVGQPSPTWHEAVHSRGTGPQTWVLLSGLIGGRAGFRALEDSLFRAGFRVVTIDPYRLSLDSADVTFEAIARRVDVVLSALDVRHARVVGHSYGAGVALRLAAFAPDRVDALFLLDAGALSTTRGKVLGRSLRLAPMLASLPGGQRYIRQRLAAGIRENSVHSEWFDDVAQHAFIDPLLADIGRVVSLAMRLGDSVERDSLGMVIARVKAPVTVILGDAPHPSGPGAAEVDALRPIGARLTVIRVVGVGHFLHEEAPAIVLGHLLRSQRGVALAGLSK